MGEEVEIGVEEVMQVEEEVMKEVMEAAVPGSRSQLGGGLWRPQ